MLTKDNFAKAKRAIESHSKYSKLTESEKRKFQGPCITISREPGSGSGVVTEKLVEYFQKITKEEDLKWSVFDKNLLEKVLADHNLPQNIVSYFTTAKVSKMNAWVNEILGVYPPEITIVKSTSQTILHLAVVGYVIIVGRGGNIITEKSPNSFHVRLVSSLENRITRIQEVYKYNRKQAIDFIETEENSRAEYVQKYFHRKIDDPTLYHLVLNSQMLSYDEIVQIIGKTIVSRFPQVFK